MHKALAAAAVSAVIVLSTSAAVAATQAAAAATKVLLAQATQQGDPAARPSRGRHSETTVGDKSAPPASPDQAPTSTNQPSVEQKEKAQKLGQELK